MRVVIQRCKYSSVTINNKVFNEIDGGMTILVGFTAGDSMIDIDYLVKKIINLRIFDDDDGIMNKSILDVKGGILSVSQFTLFASTKKGNRPSYIKALNGEEANILYDIFNKKLSEHTEVVTGLFGADMLVNINNDGPVTIIIDSKDL